MKMSRLSNTLQSALFRVACRSSIVRRRQQQLHTLQVIPRLWNMIMPSAALVSAENTLPCRSPFSERSTLRSASHTLATSALCRRAS